MAHDRYRKALSEVSAGGAAPAGFDAHLADCADCRMALARLRQALAVADEDLRQMSAVEPGAHFLPRLRAAVIESGSAPAWRGAWLWPSLAAAATVVVALALIMVQRRPLQIATRQTPVAPAATPSIPEPARAMVAASITARDHTTQPHHASQPRTPSGPEVLVPSGESRALLQLVALVEHGQSPPVLTDTDHPAAALAELRPIDIRPIEIAPLDPATQSGT